ncbi:MAG TPA: hypothetical protein VJY35_12215 [Candidatus Eisenbacteria bacterium]|nr:hypothetical protein [Candidatus Eisenbacteria bacterium]
MTQPTPDVTEQDVHRILRRDYAPADHEAIGAAIAALEVREKWRVVLACLKNGAGNTAKALDELGHASGYYRESIGEAEYPLATRKWSRIESFSDAEREAIYAKDWKQYQEWLHRS